MQKLIYMMRSNDCTLEGVGMVLDKLKWELVPQLDDWAQASPLDKRRTYAATSSLSLLPNICTTIASGGEWKEAAVGKVLDSVGGICRWMAFCMPLGFAATTRGLRDRSGRVVEDTCTSHSAVIESLLASDDRIRMLFLATPQFLDPVIWIWTAEGEAAPVTEIRKEKCVCTDLLSSVVMEESGLEMLVQQLTTHRNKKVMTQFLTATVRRIRHICKASATFPIVLKRLSDVFNILSHLLHSSAGFGIWLALLKVNFVQETTSALADLISSKAFGHAEQLLSPLLSFLNLILIHNHKRVSSIAEIFSNLKLVGLYLTAVTVIPESGCEAEVQQAVDILTIVSTYNIYPSVYPHVATLEGTGKRIPERDGLLDHAKFRNAWYIFSKQHETRREILMVTPPSLCDNPTCARWQMRFDVTLKLTSKQCSGCSMVVYCSEECQNEDWKALHSAECPSASLFNRRTASFLPKSYPHKTRAIHTSGLGSLYTSTKDFLSGNFSATFPDYAPYEVLPHFDESHGIIPKLTSGLVPLRDFDDDAPDPHPRLHKGLLNEWRIQPWLRPRVAQLVGDYRAGRLPPDARLIQMMLPSECDGIVVILLVMVREVADGYEGMYSVARLGVAPE
ncbi:hypothetical protein DFP72DRAFT_881416 [Ephemerocybe angulata]|uniref:phytol kinase n=1 Tax=Ephemerocybe angulata TaxID=980116 RepID=A0A8H6I8X7_9AGAR|nr:hypothetical protein DFP72DRAFT_881416 [Tulosesus angulatus]